MATRYAIIVAGGSGTRMGSSLPKQFLPLAGRPILLRTVEVFQDFDPAIKIILVLPDSFVEPWAALCASYECRAEHQIASGGDSRFQSVKNGLELVTEPGLVAVHDGVCPLVSHITLAEAYDQAEQHGAVVPTLPVSQSIREVVGQNSEARTSSNFRLVQSPQVFQSEILHRAYEQPYSEQFTDDASVVESLGTPIRLVNGNPENVKITSPLDLRLAHALLGDN